MQDAEAGRRGLAKCLSQMEAYDKCMVKATAKKPVEMYRVSLEEFALSWFCFQCIPVTWPSTSNDDALIIRFRKNTEFGPNFEPAVIAARHTL